MPFSNGGYLILEGLSSFEKFMKVCLGRGIRDRLAQCSRTLNRKKEDYTFSAGFTVSSVDDSCAWGFYFIYVL